MHPNPSGEDPGSRAPRPRLAGSTVVESWDSTAMAICESSSPGPDRGRVGIGPGPAATAAVRQEIKPDNRDTRPRMTFVGVLNAEPQVSYLAVWYRTPANAGSGACR
jgi:hypothetical protein